jgi:hypothetical protein
VQALLVGSDRAPSISERQLAMAAPALGSACSGAKLQPGDPYAAKSRSAGAPVYRVICGDTWFHIDGGDGQLIEKLDGSRRVYRWAFQALHTLDFPWLVARPTLRTSLIMVLCGGGLLFSLTAVLIGWRRLAGR